MRNEEEEIQMTSSAENVTCPSVHKKGVYFKLFKFSLIHQRQWKAAVAVAIYSTVHKLYVKYCSERDI